MASPLPDFSGLMARIARELRDRQIPFMFIGVQAVILHGEPRITADIDVTLGDDPSRLPELREVCAALSLTPLPADLDRFVRERFVLPTRDVLTGIRVDFIFSTIAYERQAIGRAVRVEMEGEEVPFTTAEDLIIHKLFAGRAGDLDDAMSVARRKGNQLDWDYIEAWSRAFATVVGREQMPAQVARLRASP